MREAPPPMRLETERLILRQLQEKDFEIFAAHYADEAMAKYIGGLNNRDQAWRRMAMHIGHWKLRGFGYWAVEEKSSGCFVGSVGLWRSEGWPELELGYWVTRDAHGKGYATEAARAARRHAYNVLGAETLVSYIHPDNEPSKRVAERLGARQEKTIDLLDHGPHCVYRHPKPAPEPKDRRADKQP